MDGRIAADDAAQRIEILTSEHLVPVTSTAGGWDKLFRDPSDGRFWEKTYPQSGLHGGGPPKLAVLSEKDARAKYRF